MSKLTEIAEELRNEQITFNTYNKNDNYEVAHSRAISDDATPLNGKGNNDGSIGSSDDIKSRIDNITFNKYGSDNLYGMNTSENGDD